MQFGFDHKDDKNMALASGIVFLIRTIKKTFVAALTIRLHAL